MIANTSKLGERTLSTLETVWKKSLIERVQYVDYGWNLWNEVAKGMEQGSVILSAPANIGKSSFAINLYNRALASQEDIKVIDFTLDDDEEQRLRNIIASYAGLSINDVTFAFNLDEKSKKKDAAAVAKISSLLKEGRLEINDSASFNGYGRTLETILEYIEYVRSKILSNSEKLIVVLDGFHNIELKVDRFGDNDTARQSYISGKIKAAATKYNVIFISTAHTKKGSRRRDTDYDDTKGSNAISYDATIVGTLFNDVKINGSNAEVYILNEDTNEMIQVLELNISKSKASGFNGRIFYQFNHESCQISELTMDYQNYFNSVIKNSRVRR